MTYADTQFEVATSNGLEDTFARNVTDGRMDRRTINRLWYEINIPFFRAGIMSQINHCKSLGLVA